MEKYIKSDTVLKFINGCLEHEDKITDIEKAVLTGVKTYIKRIPSADVVEVVRCGQCKHCVEHYDTDGNAPYWTCKEWDSGTDYDGYCHYGKCKNGGKEQ